MSSHSNNFGGRRSNFFRRRTWRDTPPNYQQNVDRLAQEWAQQSFARLGIQNIIQAEIRDLREDIMHERQRHLHGGPVNSDVHLEEKKGDQWVDLEAQPPPRRPKRQALLPWKATKYQKDLGSMEIDLTPIDPTVAQPVVMDLDLNYRTATGIPSHSIYLNRWDLARRRKRLLRLKVNLLQKLKRIMSKPSFINKKKY